MAVYYNEIDPFAAAWLRELMKAGEIPDGEVDERSIVDVQPSDLAEFRQCHFFAGIGGWAYALRLASWPDARPVWTGSCPCQPFSSAGKGRGKDDARHLWPQFRRLIRQCRPAVVFGEQVASKAGRIWLSAVFADLEALAYRAAGADLCVASVGAYHIRQRLWFVADTRYPYRRADGCQRFSLERENALQPIGPEAASQFRTNGTTRVLADVESDGRRQRHQDSSRGHEGTRSQGTGVRPQHHCGNGLLAHADGTVTEDSDLQRSGSELQLDRDASAGPWFPVEWIECRDGKIRPIEPGLEPLAHGIPARLGRLRGYGNAIVPQVAQVFIESYLDLTRSEGV